MISGKPAEPEKPKLGIVDMPEGADLETLAPGLYLSPERGTLPQLYDLTTNTFERNVPVGFLIRIDDRTELPTGVEAAYFRKDGKRVIKCSIRICDLPEVKDYWRKRTRAEGRAGQTPKP